MSNPTGISRRIEQCIKHLQENDHEGALVNLFPAIDKTAKRRRPKDGVGKRIKAFLQDEEALITAIGMGSVYKDCSVDGMKFYEALYKFGRTSIAHEGELDPRLKFSGNGGMRIAKDDWNLPASYIVGMSIAVIIAPENSGEKTSDGIGVKILGKSFELNNIWGNPQEVHGHLTNLFQHPGLFS